MREKAQELDIESSCLIKMNLTYALGSERFGEGVRDLKRMEMALQVKFPRKQTLNQRLTLGYAFRASLVAQMVKDLPEMQESQVQSLGREDPLEKGMATHSSILA